MERNESETDPEEQLSELDLPDRAIRTLSNPLARHALRYIQDRPETTLDAVADAVAGFEAVDTESIVTTSDRDRLRVKLYHVVLPRLDDEGFVEFDRAARTVERAAVPPGATVVLHLGD
jgi:hypothetical protein